MAAGGLAQTLRTHYDAETGRIRLDFAAAHDGRLAIRRRTALVDSLALRLWQEYVSPAAAAPAGLALIAIGGYGRGSLYPHSDIDLLFLFEKTLPGPEQKDVIRQLCQDMWDMRLKLSPTTRTLEECDLLHRDNLEFNISLLDCRYLAGDFELFRRLREQVLPKLILREWQDLVRGLSEVNEERRRKMGNTIFHLEPNLKDTPGGLRDYHLAGWLSLLNGFSRSRGWINPEDGFPAYLRGYTGQAIDFLSAVRCFLHYRAGRDDNLLSWEAQDAAAEDRIGFQDAADTAAWMRRYFHHARNINRLASIMLDDVVPARSSIYQQFQSWRSRLSNPDFSAVNGRVYLQQPSSVTGQDVFLRVFEFVAQHGFKLSGSTEQRLEQAFPAVSVQPLPGALRWQALRTVLTRPHAGLALRSMQELGVLGMLVPEFRALDSLVVRDFYHRYTVDEHTFLAIDTLHRLHKDKDNDQQRHFAELLGEIERPDLLYLAMLLHDVGKAGSAESHVDASLEAATRVCAALELPPEECETVCFLIAYHLDMSAAMRRDIFDPATLKHLAQAVGTPERLKLLCLLTYADISAVNPDAMTAWKAENLWRLYVATTNDLDRSVDDERVHADIRDEQLANIRLIAPRLGAKRLREFLEGLPRRYLRLHSPQDIVTHVELAAKLRSEAVQTTLTRNRAMFEMTVVTNDQPALFAKLAGILAAWGMNIVKADAFSNAAGVVVDTFFFTDRFHTLELNLQEWGRFQRSFVEVLTGERSLESLGSGRKYSDGKTPKVRIEPRVQVDELSALHSTLIEVVAQDRPGLLYRIASIFAENDCNIEVALIDTEGEMAIDVFYLTAARKKLPLEVLGKVRDSLLEELQPPA